jgi:hypothetical protein
VGFGSRLVGSWAVSYSQTVTFNIGASGTSGLGGPTSVALAVSRATVPAAPTNLGIDQVGPTYFRHRFAGNSNGGSAIIEWQSQVATNAAFTTGVQTQQHPTSGIYQWTNRTPGTVYYARARGRNAVGWGAWSTVTSARTLSGFEHWNGTAFGPTILRVWDGTGFKLCVLREWDGTNWKVCG